MDRRKFLKASMLGVGATMLGVPEIIASEAPRRDPIRLESNGWLKQPAREIPVVADGEKVIDEPIVVGDKE